MPTYWIVERATVYTTYEVEADTEDAARENYFLGTQVDSDTWDSEITEVKQPYNKEN